MALPCGPDTVLGTERAINSTMPSASCTPRGGEGRNTMRGDTGSGLGVSTREKRGTTNPKERKVSRDGGASVEGEDMVA